MMAFSGSHHFCERNRCEEFISSTTSFSFYFKACLIGDGAWLFKNGDFVSGASYWGSWKTQNAETLCLRYENKNVC